MKNFKKIISICVCFYLFTNNVFADFTDVSQDHPNYKAIKYMHEQKIINGYEDGSFRPDDKINRAEFLTIILETVFDNEIIGSDCFNDVQAQWFAKYICMAKDKKIIGGYPDGYFRPNKKINFAEASVIIMNGFGYKLEKNDIWYKPYVDFLREKNAVPDSILSVEKEITRGEMTEIIWRLEFEDNENENNDGYYNDKNHVYFENKIIEDADSKSFEFIGWMYAKDKNNAYYRGKKIDNVDILTFEHAGTWYAKDKNVIYVHGKKIDESNPESFEDLKEGYAKDKNNVYYSEKYFPKLWGIEKKEGELDFKNIGGSYGKNFDKVYYKGMFVSNLTIKNSNHCSKYKNFDVGFDCSFGERKKALVDISVSASNQISDFDGKNCSNNSNKINYCNKYLIFDNKLYFGFSLLPYGMHNNIISIKEIKNVDLDSFEYFDGTRYAKDKNNVYYLLTNEGDFAVDAASVEIVEGADVKTFQVFDGHVEYGNLADNNVMRGYFAKDKNNNYFKNEKIDINKEPYKERLQEILNECENKNSDCIANSQFLKQNKELLLNLPHNKSEFEGKKKYTCNETNYCGEYFVSLNKLYFGFGFDVIVKDPIEDILVLNNGDKKSIDNILEPREIENADLNSFEYFSGTTYAKDKNNVYFLSNGTVTAKGFGSNFIDIVKGADLETFEVINPTFARDKNTVYKNGEPVEIYSRTKIDYADPETFEVFSNKCSKDKNTGYYYMNNIQYNINDGKSDGKTFECLDNGYSRDKNHIYKEHKTVKEIE